jgi:hypothetical protein
MTECLLDRTSEPVDSLLETWGELLETLDFELGSTHRVVTAVRFEGVDQPSYRADEVRGRSLAGLARVEVESAGAEDLLHDTIMTGRDSVAVLAAGAIQVADTFRGLNINAAHSCFAELAEGVRQLTLLTAAVAAVAVVDLNALSCVTPEASSSHVPAQAVASSEPESATQIIDGVSVGLQRLLVWQTAHDWVGAADCLEYDLAPALDRWSSVFDAVEQELTKKTNGGTR